MADRLLALAAHQRIGTALSRQLLGMLRAYALHIKTARVPLGAMRGLEGTDLDPQPSSSATSNFVACPDTQQDSQNALAPLPEAGKFRVYSSFGHNVQAIPSTGDAEIGNVPMAAEDEDHLDVTASGPAALPELLDDPIRRRSWLLAKALETHPLDQALDLARVAEAFITGSPATETAPAAPASDRGHSARPAAGARVNRGPQPKQQRVRLALAAEERDRLLERLAQGARNAELASEFNLSPKQVQGIRIGSAREISRRRNAASNQR